LTQRVFESICLRPAYVIKHSRRKKTTYYGGKLGPVCRPPGNLGKKQHDAVSVSIALFASQKYRPL